MLQISTKYKEIAEKLIDKFPVCFGHLELDKILFLEESQKNPSKFADIRNVGTPWNFITSYKFIITFYEPKMIGLTEAQQVIVVEHELLHIDEDFSKLNKHDIQDFRIIASKYGLNWDIDPNVKNPLNDESESI